MSAQVRSREVRSAMDQSPGCWECHEPYYTFAPRCPYCDAPNPNVLLAEAIDRSVAKQNDPTLAQRHPLRTV